ncbi:unnamed protein product [Phaeothamnion confervicola]
MAVAASTRSGAVPAPASPGSGSGGNGMNDRLPGGAAPASGDVAAAVGSAIHDEDDADHGGARGDGGDDGDAGSEDASSDVSSDDGEEERRLDAEEAAYCGLGLRMEDLVVVEINANRVFAVVSNDRKLTTVRENEIMSIYELEPAVAVVAAVAAGARAGDGSASSDGVTPPPPSVTPPPSATPPSLTLPGLATPPRLRARPLYASVFAESPTSAATALRLLSPVDGEATAAGVPEADEATAAAAAGEPLLSRIRAVGEGPTGSTEEERVTSGPAPYDDDGGSRNGAVSPDPRDAGGRDADAGAAAPIATNGGGGYGGGGDGSGSSEVAGAPIVEDDVSSEGATEMRLELDPEREHLLLRRPQRLYYAVLHRSLEHSPTYFINPYRLQVFGTPLVCTTPAAPPMTGRQLYTKLRRRFARFVRPPPPPARAKMRANMGSFGSFGSLNRLGFPSSGGNGIAGAVGVGGGGSGGFAGGGGGGGNGGYGNDGGDGSGGSGGYNGGRDAAFYPPRSGYGGSGSAGGGAATGSYHQHHGSVGSDASASASRGGGGCSDARGLPSAPSSSTPLTCEAVAAGPVNDWGFRVRFVNNNGTACSRCRWLSGCVGCEVVDDDTPVALRDGDTLAVDWHISVMKERYDAAEALSVFTHSSVAESGQAEMEPLSLAKCMDTFTAEEKIQEGYCSRCKALRNARLKMDIWRLPPVLAIHLKRFQYTTYSRRKLRNLVRFPVHGLDLSPYIVKDDDRPPPGSPGLPPGPAKEREPPLQPADDPKPLVRQPAEGAAVTAAAAAMGAVAMGGAALKGAVPAGGASASVSVSAAAAAALDATAAEGAGEVWGAPAAAAKAAPSAPGAEESSAIGTLAGHDPGGGGVDGAGRNARGLAASPNGGVPVPPRAAVRSHGTMNGQYPTPPTAVPWPGPAESGAPAGNGAAARRPTPLHVLPPSSGSGSVSGGNGGVGNGGAAASNGGGASIGASGASNDGAAAARGNGDEEQERGVDGREESYCGVMSSKEGRDESLYDLYAVVHHLGALSAGHYVASVRSQATGKWHYFNDNQITEVQEDDLVSPSAYILFYIRRDVRHLRTEEVFPVGAAGTAGAHGLSEAEIEVMMRQRDAGRCTVM